MGGPALEILRFGLYVFVPIGAFYYCNLPEFYETKVKPRADEIYNMRAKQAPPQSREEAVAMLEEMKQKRREARATEQGK